MKKKPIENCLCGEQGAGTVCTATKHGRCEWCGFDKKVNAYRKHLLETKGLVKLKNGMRGIPLKPWEVVS